jgi:hypothetical protein
MFFAELTDLSGVNAILIQYRDLPAIIFTVYFDWLSSTLPIEAKPTDSEAVRSTLKVITVPFGFCPSLGWKFFPEIPL